MTKPLKPYRAWKGALELTINGVQMPVNVEFYARVKASRSKSFRNLAPSGQPVEGRSFDPATGEQLEADQVQKGWDLGKKQFAIIPAETIEAIAAGTKTTVLAPEQFADVDSIAWDLAINRWAVQPNAEVIGADQAVNIVWNGLKHMKKAWVTQASLGGGQDVILCLYADQHGLWAAALPFDHELYPTPTPDWMQENDQAGQLFETMTNQEHADKIGPFEHDKFVSEYATRREQLITEAIENGGHLKPAEKAVVQKPAAPDLMAMMSAAIAKPKKTKPKSKAV